MTEAESTKTDQAEKRRRNSARKSTPPVGEVTYIRVPKPPASAFNKNRPIGLLLQAQLQHIRHAESARLPKEKRDGRRPEEIHTEAEAASYIAAVTKILDPQRRRKPKPKPAS
jgi:hypothetical protein